MDLSAREIMTTDVETASPDDEVGTVLERLAKADFNGFPIVEDGRVVGIVTQGDFVRLFRKKDRLVWIPIGVPPFSETLPYAVDFSLDELDLGIDFVKNARKDVREIMTTDVVTVEADSGVGEVLSILAGEDRDINRVPVLEDGGLVGIITREDLLRALRVELDR
ncbi:CBS domain-containing protein [Halalkalicoccus jeotgali]|uniref:CBS domain containing membrane protein n=1 Tax=Halalkalicoccus jeotgali (strain DSM 18796 / CECT 7217 / JCM 14584 / KCTC 4019 / B3) TaxID=795797 RepID=D8JA70_HALJB|nr:CBS domain-containing protein [Halalkalicoccus jeotgali]ADJ14592.1 CBS domain containing membrane protein [Halalkalicoccus jeotgali B3]ELY39964.1 CBS domain containing membrane protein [Halalkalicoccus jeotgali B3]